MLAKLAASSKRLRRYSLRQILTILFRRYVYQIIWVGEYGARMESIRALDGEFPYHIEFLRAEQAANLALNDPNLSAQDIAQFKQCDATCILVKDQSRIIASAWMVSDGHVYYCDEFDRNVEIPESDYFLRRSYVDPDYRGQRISGHMLAAFVTAQPKSGRFWAYFYNWNTNSINAVRRIGLDHDGNVGFAKLFGVPFTRRCGTDRKVGHSRSGEISPTGQVRAK